MTIRRALPAALTCLAVAAVASGCRGTAPDTAASAGKDSGTVSIMVGGLDKVIYLPAELTQQLGYFKDEGLNVKLLGEPSGSQAENVLIAGKVDGVVGFYDHTVALQTQGKCLTSVVQLSKAPGEVEMAPAKSSVSTPADFGGKRLGVTSTGSSTDFLTQALAVGAGVQPKDYTTVKAGAGQTFIAALQQGSIDAGMTTDPTVARLVKSGQGKVLLDMRTEEGSKRALGGPYPSSSLYMDCAYVAAHKQTVQKLANAFVQTLHWMSTHDAKAIAAKMPADFSAGDPALYAKAIADTKPMFTDDGVMPAGGPETVLRVLGSFNENVKGKEKQIDLSKTYTSEFVKAAPQG
jgi:NitT/TauT family transport system substrate-binding protein